mmetsp:Transcript_7635/g.17281  ORF Transcript_7635/g.17281 Transcript_7635/m.17281 type:complete len:192 (+) Transcript_7635:16-591(+)
MAAKEITHALKLCKGINDTSIDALKRANVNEMKALRDAARLMADHLDSAIVKMTPCKYNATTVEKSIDGFRQYKFKKMSGLCNYNLSPIIETQVGEAIRAERGELAIEMLIPIIDFFNDWSDLDDSYGEGGVFVNEWASQMEEAISLLQPNWQNDDLIEEVLESIGNMPSHFVDDESVQNVISELSEFQDT